MPQTYTLNLNIEFFLTKPISVHIMTAVYPNCYGLETDIFISCLFRSPAQGKFEKCSIFSCSIFSVFFQTES